MSPSCPLCHSSLASLVLPYRPFGLDYSLGYRFTMCVSLPEVYYAMQKVNEDLYAKPEDATDFLASLKSEPGMYCEYTLDSQGRLVDIFWSTAGQQENIARFGGCIQLDTTAFTNRCRNKLRQVRRSPYARRYEYTCRQHKTPTANPSFSHFHRGPPGASQCMPAGTAVLSCSLWASTT